jgi:hypothetical protein
MGRIDEKGANATPILRCASRGIRRKIREIEEIRYPPSAMCYVAEGNQTDTDGLLNGCPTQNTDGQSMGRSPVPEIGRLADRNGLAGMGRVGGAARMAYL